MLPKYLRTLLNVMIVIATVSNTAARWLSARKPVLTSGPPGDYTGEEISELIKLPPELDKFWPNRGYYGGATRGVERVPRPARLVPVLVQHRDAMKTLAIAACLALAAPPAAACGSGFVLGDEVGAAHPASIGVAFAMLDARNAGMLVHSNDFANAGTRVSADEAAHRLEPLLAPVKSRLPAMSLLLVEARLWTRYAPAGRSRHADEHAGHDAWPVEGDVVVVTGEAVLRGLLAGRIAWQQAVDSGLVVLSGDPARQTRVAAVLAARFAQQGDAAMASRAGSRSL
ncbi:hypothetical protein [Cupriavidus alkaliphilus]|uniref:Uncharacterized protein n=1 Tax=Cupriavidus alkaliphilus TaxID=942866 RepID=A0A7W4VEC4_9BURK|nr:hypothetical protein [Cupriavidus alkaliphilus]MBB3009729.1 hypothetical protein [Cupriavidus alkaliphilus]